MTMITHSGSGRSICIGQDRFVGVDGVEREQMPPELLQKIREALAAGIARNFIAKSLAELQLEGTKAQVN